MAAAKFNNVFEQELRQVLGEDNLNKIKSTKIGIAGAGGLGSNCAVNLVRSGFSKLKIVDFDKVSVSNLNRQFYFYNQIGMFKVDALKDNLLKINSCLELELLKDKINEKNVRLVFADCDIVVEAFDKAVYKALLVESYYASEKFMVAASGLAGFGKCDAIVSKKVRKNFFLVGDSVSVVMANNPPLAPRVNIVAAKQADLILEYVLYGEIK